MSTVALSAWNFSQPPPLVRGLESAFVSNVAAHVASSSCLFPASRREIGTLIASGAAAREIGDALYMAYARDWARGLQEKYGEKEVRLFWYGADRFGQPFRAAPAKVVGEGGDVLEVFVPANRLGESASDALTGGMGLMVMGFETKPYYIFKYPTHNRSRTILRFARPTLMEEGLLRFFGRSSMRLCLTAGLVTPKQNLRLHKLGYHPFGLPMQGADVHGFDASPLGCAVHDAGHAVFASSHVDSPTRLAACLLYEAAGEVFNRSQKERVDWSLTSIEDLNLQFVGGIAAVLKQWRKELPVRAFRKAILTFLEKWEDARAEIGPNAEMSQIGRRAKALIACR